MRGEMWFDADLRVHVGTEEAERDDGPWDEGESDDEMSGEKGRRWEDGERGWEARLQNDTAVAATL